MNYDNKKDILNKEIDLIQSCINRMAQNSFIVKGWLFTIITVVLALLPEKINVKILCIIGFVITFCFWYLDAFFIKMEKIYRWKYEWVICNRISSNDYYYDLNPTNSKMWLQKEDKKTKQFIDKKEPYIIRIMVTKTLSPIYVPVILAIIFIFINQYTKWL
ncbi:hypothetical protein QA584_17495 [Anaerocolumna sp. AGMB13025]|uniref:hypothetical protein n=1 Tax=Anaerocolumna sp. AGMB13025 TaxID=3039116 RepID=UPI00241FDECF|nr:hypothetical protein [Anaerocolumna sp. AGMB13025]WFR55396.1 hypothetical protein QA584_17495 [Anaerocolumna sp. AGMB13025]